MNTLRPVRLKIAWGQWPKGWVFTAMPNSQSSEMVRLGTAEYVVEALESPMNRAMTGLTEVIRRRGRPPRQQGIGHGEV